LRFGSGFAIDLTMLTLVTPFVSWCDLFLFYFFYVFSFVGSYL